VELLLLRSPSIIGNYLHIDIVGPFTSASRETVKIDNKDTSRTLLFKVKTTAPKQYTVKPNSGKIEPNTAKEISS
jgi:hypothetical protein